MSDYDYRPTHERGAGAMDYAGTNSGGGIWAFIGLIAVVALVGLILFGAANAPQEGGETAPITPEAAAPVVGE